ncbi:hypothetical protein HGRIS_004342 [Hohenbuehelia grisea]|uniref:Uncharacterized protein n=1 Tax=Hohenbuehelia grisea TaxID=104357 RepID=A0ABR3IPN0_9AGAR
MATKKRIFFTIRITILHKLLPPEAEDPPPGARTRVSIGSRCARTNSQRTVAAVRVPALSTKRAQLTSDLTCELQMEVPPQAGAWIRAGLGGDR